MTDRIDSELEAWFALYQHQRAGGQLQIKIGEWVDEQLTASYIRTSLPTHWRKKPVPTTRAYTVAEIEAMIPCPVRTKTDSAVGTILCTEGRGMFWLSSRTGSDCVGKCDPQWLLDNCTHPDGRPFGVVEGGG